MILLNLQATRKSIHDLPPEEQKRVRQMKKDSRERCIERQEREKRERAENSSDEEEIGVPQTKRARQIKKASRGGCKEKKKMEKRDMAENSSDEEEIGIPKKRLRQGMCTSISISIARVLRTDIHDSL